MCAPRASASTSSGCAYSRSIRSRTRRSRARSRRCCAAAGLLVICESCHVAPEAPNAADDDPGHDASRTATPYGCPRQDSNLRFRLRRPALYPLSYGGCVALGSLTTALSGLRARRCRGGRRRSAILGACRNEACRNSTIPVILLVDDDPVITRLLEVNFRLVGFRVAAVARGDVALERARAVPPSAIVLDVMLPGLGGYEVCRQMRLIPSWPTCRWCSSPRAHPTRTRPPRAGWDPWTSSSKPFEPGDLVELIRRRVAERQRS